MPWVVPVRHRAVDALPYLVALSEADPLSGTADIGRLTQIQVDGEPIGLVTGATMNRVRNAINDIFAG